MSENNNTREPLATCSICGREPSDFQCRQHYVERVHELEAEAERLRDRVCRAEDRLAMELDKQIQREKNRLANLKEMRRLADEADYHVSGIVDLTEQVSRT